MIREDNERAENKDDLHGVRHITCMAFAISPAWRSPYHLHGVRHMNFRILWLMDNDGPHDLRSWVTDSSYHVSHLSHKFSIHVLLFIYDFYFMWTKKEKKTRRSLNKAGSGRSTKNGSVSTFHLIVRPDPCFD